MHSDPTAWPAWTRCLALLGMSMAAFTSTSIETLIPAMGLGIGLEALVRLLLAAKASDADRERLQASFGLAISAAIFLRPSYSILTLSFILLLQLLLWLVGDGVFRLWAARDRYVETERSRHPAPASGSASFAWMPKALALVAAAQIGFGVALHLWPGAGALHRGPVLGGAFILLALASALEARFETRAARNGVPSSPERAPEPRAPGKR